MMREITILLYLLFLVLGSGTARYDATTGPTATTMERPATAGSAWHHATTAWSARNYATTTMESTESTADDATG